MIPWNSFVVYIAVKSTTTFPNKPRATRQSVDQAVKSICDIMRRGNMAGAMQYVPELTWILFLRILDEIETQEQDEAEAVGIAFTPSLATPYRWRDWAAPDGIQRKVLEDGRSGRCQERCRFFSLYFETLPAPSEGLVCLG